MIKHGFTIVVLAGFGLAAVQAEAAKRDCAVSKALAGVKEINLEAKLVEHAG